MNTRLMVLTIQLRSNSSELRKFESSLRRVVEEEEEDGDRQWRLGLERQ